MLLNEGPVTMTTMKLKVQLLAVARAFAGARMRRPTISAGFVKKMLAIRGMTPEQNMYTHIEPGHSQPADGEERIEDKQQYRRNYLRRGVVDASKNRQEDHSYRLPDRAE